MEIIINGYSVNNTNESAIAEACGYHTLPGCDSYCNCDCNGDH